MADQPAATQSKGPKQIGATLFLKKPAVIDLARLQKATGSLLSASDIAAAAHSPDDPNSSLVLPTSGDAIMTVPMPRPYPVSLRQQAQFAHWWPTAEKDIAGCTSHLMVFCPWRRFSRVEAHVRHTHLIAGLLEQLPAVGVLWGSSLVHTDLVRQMTANMLARKGLPVQLWVLFQFSRKENGNSLISTVGMADLGHMEIETDCELPLQEAYGVVLKFANWLINREAPMADGSKYEFAPGMSPIVRHGKSFRRDVPGTVYWLHFEGATRH